MRTQAAAAVAAPPLARVEIELGVRGAEAAADPDSTPPADADDADRATTAACSRHQLRAAAASLLAFWGIAGIHYAFFLAVASLPSSGGDAPRLPLWWVAPPLEALFHLGNLFSAAYLTRRFMRRPTDHAHQGWRTTAAFLVGFYGVVLVTFWAAPEFAFLEPAPIERRPFSSGKCTRVADMTTATEQQYLLDSCPRFANTYFQVDAGVSQTLEKTLPASESADSVLASVLVPASRLRVALAFVFSRTLGRLFDQECVEILTDTICTTFLTPCRHGDCEPSDKGARCSGLHHVNEWMECGRVNEPYTGTGTSTSEGHAWREKSDQEFYRLFPKFCGDYSGPTRARCVLTEMLFEMRASQETLFSPFERQFIEVVANRTLSMFANAAALAQPPANCPGYWENSTAIKEDDDVDLSTRLGCNPEERYYYRQASATAFDSGHAMLFCFLALSTYVLIVGRTRAPKLLFVDAADRNTRIITLALGHISSGVLVLVARRFEMAAVVPGNTETARTLNLQIVGACYYLVSWLHLHHSWLLLVLRRRKQTKASKQTRSKSRAQQCLAALKGPWKQIRRVKRHFTNSAGKYNVFYLAVREVFENVVQFFGIQATGRSRDVRLVSFRTAVLSANLLAVPLVAVLFWRKGGPLAGRGAAIIVEGLFDRAFVIVGAVLTVGQQEITLDESVWGQVLEHAPSLLPALLFLLQSRSSLMALAAMHNVRHSEARAAAARQIQHWHRHRKRERRRSSKWLNVVQLARSSQALPSRSVVRKRRSYCQYRFATVALASLSVISIALGVVLFVHVATAVASQSQECERQAGRIATCLWPRVFFANGIFGERSCAFDRVVAANCSRSGLLEEELPEAPRVFAAMGRLTHIDLSHNEQLRQIPFSFRNISNLESLDLSGCANFAELPFDVCASQTLVHVDLTGTVAQTRLDWSGQLGAAGIGRGCHDALGGLESLDLSHNSLGNHSCPRELDRLGAGCGALWLRDEWGNWQAYRVLKALNECKFDRLRLLLSFPKLSFLDLGHNDLQHLSNRFFQLTHMVESNTGTVLLQGNPIRTVSLVGESEARAKGVMARMKANYASAVGLESIILSGVPLTRVKNLFAGWPNLKWLKLEGMAVTVLDATDFEGLDSLLELGISAASRLQALESGAFHNLKSLTYLELTGSSLEQIAPGAFDGLKSLNRLNLRGNRMRTVNRSVFNFSMVRNRSLRLHLGKNTIQSIKPDAFRGMSYLTHLYLGFNNLTAIDNGTFAGLSGVHEIDLSANPISSIEVGAWAGLPTRSMRIGACQAEDESEFVSTSEFEHLVRSEASMLASVECYMPRPSPPACDVQKPE